MRGLEYLDDHEDRNAIKTKRVPSKEPIKKADHKHDYQEMKVIKDNLANLNWERIFYKCIVCGKEKQEAKSTNP